MRRFSTEQNYKTFEFSISFSQRENDNYGELGIETSQRRMVT